MAEGEGGYCEGMMRGFAHKDYGVEDARDSGGGEDCGEDTAVWGCEVV